MTVHLLSSLPEAWLYKQRSNAVSVTPYSTESEYRKSKA